MKILTREEACQVWKTIGPGIWHACTRNGPPSGLHMMGIAQAILNGSAKVLVGDEGFGVVFVDGEVCNLLAYQGTLREIRKLKKEFVDLARQTGCKKIRITGDPAWMRVVPELKQRSVVMEMAID